MLSKNYLKKYVEIGEFKVTTNFNNTSGPFYFVGGSPVGVVGGTVGLLNPTLDRYWGTVASIEVGGSLNPIGISVFGVSGSGEPFTQTGLVTIFSWPAMYTLVNDPSEPVAVVQGTPQVGHYVRPALYDNTANDGKKYAVWEAVAPPTSAGVYFFYGQVIAVGTNEFTIWFSPVVIKVS